MKNLFAPLRHPDAKTAPFIRWWGVALRQSMSLVPGALADMFYELSEGMKQVAWALLAAVLYIPLVLLSPLLAVVRAYRARRCYFKNLPIIEAKAE